MSIFNMKKRNKLLIITTMLLLMPTMAFAEEGEPTPAPTTNPVVSPTPTPSVEPTIAVTGVNLSLSKINMVVGDTKQLEATVTPDNATNTKITWSSSNTSVATVDENGKVTAIKAGNATITASAKDDQAKKATCEIEVAAKQETVKSNDATIKNLSIKNGTLDKAFKQSDEEYIVTVAKDVTGLEFNIELSDKKAGTKIANNSSIHTGTIVKVVVTAEDGKTNKTYKFTVKKEESNLNLKSLKIKGYALNETFNTNILEYTADIPFEATDVTIQAATEDSNATVKITGATGLIVGKNTVTVTVTDTSGNQRTYKVVVTRLAEDERVETGHSSKYTSPTSSNAAGVGTSDEDSGSNHTLRYVFVTIGCLILLAIGGIGIYFYIITSTKKKDKKSKKKNKNIDKDKEKETINQTDNDVKEESTTKKSNSIMPGDLEATREFRPDDFADNKSDEKVRNDVEKLFEDE